MAMTSSDARSLCLVDLNLRLRPRLHNAPSRYRVTLLVAGGASRLGGVNRAPAFAVAISVLIASLMAAAAIGLEPGDCERGRIDLRLEAPTVTIDATDFVATVIGPDFADGPALRFGERIEPLDRFPIGKRHVAVIIVCQCRSNAYHASPDKSCDRKAFQKWVAGHGSSPFLFVLTGSTMLPRPEANLAKTKIFLHPRARLGCQSLHKRHQERT